MAITSQRSQTSYAGFIDGYIAGNLSANSKELNLHNEKIVSFLQELKKDRLHWPADVTIRERLNDAYTESEKLLYKNDIEYYFELGEILLRIYALMDDIRKTTPLPSTLNFNLKKIIYHYLNIANALKDRKVTKKAKEIVAKFEDSASQS